MADEMVMNPVTSSQLAAVGYDPETKVMRVEFTKGQLYEYQQVPEDVYQALMSAPSIGQQFNATVKWAFSYERLA